MRERALALFLAIWMTCALTGCGKEPPAPPEPPVIPPHAEEPEPEPEPYVPAGTNPLTGEAMEPEYENNRPIAVMLNNLKAAQPQLGVSRADIIYEVPAEGGITRMLGVYQSLEGVGNLGSIRSARSYYLELALGLDAVYVHAGGSPGAYRDIPAWGVDNLDGVRGDEDAKLFWRDQERRKTKGYEHSLLTSGGNIQAYLDMGSLRAEHERGYVYPQAFVPDGTPAGGSPAEHVEVRFSAYKTGTFDYNAGMGKYLVGQYGKEYVDGDTGEQVAVTNLLVLETGISVISGDTEGRLNVRLTGEGAGTFFCGGKSVPIQWSKADRNSPFVYTLENGKLLALGQGNSYVCIISPKTSKVTFE